MRLFKRSVKGYPRRGRHGEGIIERHSRTCAKGTKSGRSSCTCTPTFRAWVWDKDLLIFDRNNRVKTRGGKRSQSFPTRAAAVGWRRDALREMEKRERMGKVSNTFGPCPSCGLASRTPFVAPHGSEPCPVLLVEHQARLDRIRESGPERRRIWRKLHQMLPL